MRRRLDFLIGTIVLFVVAVLLVNRGFDEARARWNGFEGPQDWKAAIAAGVADPIVWRAQQLEQAAAARQVAQASEEAARKAAAELVANCPNDLQCWATKNEPAAVGPCKKEIQRLANWQFEWLDGWLTPVFSRYGWADQRHSRVLYRGDKIKFSNGFGGWQNYVYDCVFDTDRQRVIVVKANKGIL